MERFKIDVEVKTTVEMTDEDIGEGIEVGSIGIVNSEPSDNEELVGVFINNCHHYLPQWVLEVV